MLAAALVARLADGAVPGDVYDRLPAHRTFLAPATVEGRAA